MRELCISELRKHNKKWRKERIYWREGEATTQKKRREAHNTLDFNFLFKR